jgi:hypothetical protein
MYGHQSIPIRATHAALHVSGKDETEHPQRATDLNRSEPTHMPTPVQALPVVTVRTPTQSNEAAQKGSGESFASAFSKVTAGTLTPRLTKEQLKLYTPRKREKTTTTRISLDDRGKAPGKWDILEGDGILKNIFKHVSFIFPR